MLGLSASAAETSLKDRKISFGPYENLNLLETITHSGIPVSAAKDAFQFFDQFESTTRTYRQLELYPFIQLNGALGFHPNRLTTLTAKTISNKQYMVIFDLNLHSSKKRLHVIDLYSGEVESTLASHGIESECGGTHQGYACRFISDRESKASPLGFFVTAERYEGKNGTSIRLNGLEGASAGFPGNTFPSTIIIHPAEYVTEGHAGHSAGCPAMNRKILEKLKDKLAGGVLFYFFHSSLNYPDRAPIVENLLPNNNELSK